MIALKAVFTVVADLFDRGSSYAFVIVGAYMRGGFDLSADHEIFPRDKHFGGDARGAIALQKIIDDAIGDYIGAFIGVSGAYRFRCE